MKLSWTAEARQDRRAIFSYIRKDNPAAAADMDDEFVRAAAQLSRHPFSGRVGRVEDTRELLVHPSYLIIYDIRVEMIRVLGIIHTARQWPPE